MDLKDIIDSHIDICMGCTANTLGCIDQYNCVEGLCPDFLIKRNDNKPDFRVKVEDCDGPMDLTNLVLEANMWASAKLKSALSLTDLNISLADNIGFNQIAIGDVIFVNKPRQAEYMLVTSFDEVNYSIRVQRAYHNTTAQNFKKGQEIKIIKFMNSSSVTEMIFQDVINIDGTTSNDTLTESFLVYNWQLSNTSLPGCYTFEFKLMKMNSTDVEWVRRFPSNSEGYKIKIYDSPTSEI